MKPINRDPNVRHQWEREVRIHAAGEGDPGTLDGVASVMGVMCRTGDVILPGAFAPAVLREFVANGSMLVGHDWERGQVGIIEEAKVRGMNLEVRAKFHRDPEAQTYRMRAMERIEAGKAVGLSIGFRIADGGYTFYDSGAEMLAALETQGVDLSGFDTLGIKKRKGWCYSISKVSEVYEFSLVTVPANPPANAREIRGETFDNQFSGALGALESLLDRWEDLRDTRGDLGPSHLTRLAEVTERLERLAAAVRPVAPEPESDESRAERVRQLMARAEALTAS